MLAAAAALPALLALCLALPLSRAQIGSDCSDSAPCAGPQQECSLGYCRCLGAFVKINKDCLPERGFNETCAFDDQCTDFRLKCSGEGRCECVKYYHWDEFSKQCLTHKDLKYMLIDMEEKHDTSGRLIAETSRVFTGMMWTGLAVMIVGLLLGSGCLFYGCCYSRVCCTSRRDKLSDDRSPTGPSPRTQQAAVPGSLGARAVTQGAGVDYIPALYDTTSFDII